MKKFIIAVLVAVMFAGCTVATASPQDFIDRMGPVAQEIVPQYGLWPSVFLAQAALESGWGKSWLATTANNFFGRKCLELPCLEIKTPEYRKGQRMIELHSFQVYDSIPAAVHGYCQQFFRRYASGAPVYPEMDASTPETQIRSIAGRYATDPRYADKVLSIIYEWDLQKYDRRE
jgi:flagellum-specific peptidoglycan hydrolase FlgJ